MSTGYQLQIYSKEFDKFRHGNSAAPHTYHIKNVPKVKTNAANAPKQITTIASTPPMVHGTAGGAAGGGATHDALQSWQLHESLHGVIL